MTLKASLRLTFLKLRKELSFDRRQAATEALMVRLQSLPYRKIASFIPFGTEIDLMPFNHILAQEGRLCLPRCQEDDLHFYDVEELDQGLIRTAAGFLEPDPLRHKKTASVAVECVLVPGLAFDEAGFRLGYGKGHYDKLLSRLSVRTLGVGFHEQKITQLPRDPWDIPVQELFFC